MNERFERGMETVTRMVGEEEVKASLESIHAFFPDFYKAIVEFGFGDLYSRPALDLKQRELLTLSSLITQGAEGQLPFHLNAALNVGLTPEEIAECVFHLAGYAGFPRACGALAILAKVLQERGIQLHTTM